MGHSLVWSALTSTAKLGNFFQIILFLPLTLSTLSKNAFLLLSLLLFLESVAHGTFLLFIGSPAFHFTQLPAHSLLLLLCFNIFSRSVSTFVLTLTSWWGTILKWSGPLFIVLEGMSTLLVVQKVGRIGRDLVDEGEVYQFGLLIASAVAYVISASWIVISYPAAADSPLSSTLLGSALTAFIFLTFIGLALRRTNIIESSGMALFIAYNIWLCGFGKHTFSDSVSAYAPLLENLLPHLQTLTNFVFNTLPKHVLVALVYRISILLGAARVLPSIGADSWEGADDGWNGRPTSKLTRVLLMYRQAILVTVYSHLLLLDLSSHSWWRWMDIYFTLFIWGIELLVTEEDDVITKDWKVD
ncbi:hypothetical protein K488DRAFT_78302 [Vararia minispora EC-137]|uniref:Uncharacterized protein n=1 Tax=Vararia minispora EC-137 TaxID=1314806 RepID=A0ACB8QLK6_9AGAM|nr:hypothetical protein K488DRAFT_78302 [Vararia minispora EC-137]